MKICFYCDTVFTFGGVQRVLAVLAKSMSKEHDITILTLDSPSLNDTTMYGLDAANIHYINLQYPKVPFYENILCKTYSFLYKNVLPQNKILSKWYGYSSFSHTKRLLLIKTLNQGDYDIVVGVHVFLSFHLASISKHIKARTVGWMHNSYDAFFSIKTSYIGNLKRLFIHLMPNLDKLVVLSKYDKEKYLKELGIESEVIYNPLTIESKGICSPENKKFLAVGRFSHLHKGFDLLIEAFASFAKLNQGWNLDIVGEGPEEEMLRSLISKHHLEERIKIHPFTKEIEQHYSSASIYILSSRWEGFPLVLFEAMSFGLPIISSDISIAKEIIENKDVGILFRCENVEDLANKMKIMSECENLHKMSESAIKYTENVNISNITLLWNRLFSNLTN